MKYDMQRKLTVFQPIVRIVENSGFSWVWGNSDTLTVLPANLSQLQDHRLFLFSVANHGGRWFMGVQDTRARLAQIYRIDEQAQLVNLIGRLLRVHDKQSLPIILDDSLVSQYRLVSMSFSELVSEQMLAQRQQWHQFGWEHLVDSDQNEIWRQMSVGFPYHSTGQLPTPSVTWDLSACLENSEVVENELEPDFINKLLMTMRRHTRLDGVLYVMVEDSTSYRFMPHAANPAAFRDYWAVSPFPGSDNKYFLSPDFKFGLMANWRGTLCIFGENFLASIIELAPRILTGCPSESHYG
jgi:Protein of unknown function (DUF2716)